MLVFKPSGSFKFTEGPHIMTFNLYGENAKGIPEDYPGTTLFMYMSGSAFQPYPMD